MDRKIEVSFYKKNRTTILTTFLLTTFLLYFGITSSGDSKSIRVNLKDIQLSEIRQEQFVDYIPLDATLIPQTTIYLDVQSGGRVKKVFAEEGTEVKIGDPLLELSNSNLRLDIINRETQLIEQENFLRNTELSAEQNRLNLLEKYSNLKYKVILLRRKYLNDSTLYSQNLISKNVMLSTKEEFEYFKEQKKYTEESMKYDIQFYERQIQKLKNSIGQLNKNYQIVKKVLDELTIRATFNGRLTNFDPKVGESIAAGERIGQIDDLSNFKLEAFLDEYHLNKLNLNLKATTTGQDKNLTFRINKIFSSVKDGKVRIELNADQALVKSMKRGQRVSLKLELGKGNNALVLERGAFYNNSLGRWVYRLDENGNVAERKEIRIGRQNPLFFEVIDDLDKGDKIIISSYENFEGAEKLKLY